MAKHSGPVCRLCRREGMKLFLKGERCLTKKCSIERRAYPPGMAGQKRVKIKEYGIQLREKQKVKRLYGVLENQFRMYFYLADRTKGVTGDNLLRLLELRLDTVVNRLGFASSQAMARQLVRHNHVLVNGKKVNIPSYRVKQGDVVEVREKSRKSPYVVASLERRSDDQIPAWLELDRAVMRGSVAHLPARDDVKTPIEEQLIVELYSK